MKYLFFALSVALISCSKQEDGGDITGTWKLQYIEKDGIKEDAGGTITFKSDGRMVYGRGETSYFVNGNTFYTGDLDCWVRFDVIGNNLIIYYKVSTGITSGTCTLGYDQYKTYLSR